MGNDWTTAAEIVRALAKELSSSVELRELSCLQTLTTPLGVNETTSISNQL